MAEITPPAWMEAGTYLAQQDRQALMALMTPNPSGLFAPLGGVRPASGTPMGVAAQSSPNMSVSVSSGTVFVPAAIAANAGWACLNNGARTVTIAAANPSHPRIDLIVAHVYDATDDVGPTSSWALEAVQGTPATSPVAPAQPTNSLVLATVAVASGATSITSGNITDKRTWSVALGGVLPVLSTALPASPYPGQMVYCADTGKVLVWQGPASPSPSSWQSPGTGMGPWGAAQSAAITWINDGSWRVISGFGPVAFTVPPTGAVFVTVTAGLGSVGATSTAQIGWKIHDPAVGDTGPNFVAFNSKNAYYASNGSSGHGSCRTLVTGLTPGAALQAIPGNQSTNSTPHDDGFAALMVEAQQ
jgi:hypothetical protein